MESQKVLAFSTCVKLLHIINGTISLSNHVKSCMALRSVPALSHMEPWQALVPIIGHTDKHSVRFDSDEMAVFSESVDFYFMQNMMLIAARNA